MNEFKLLLRKDYFIVLNNVKLILRNPLRLLPYLFVVGYFGFFYLRRTKKTQELDPGQLGEFQDAAEQMGEVDFALQNVTGGLTLLALAFLMFQLYRATKKNISFFSMADVNLLFTAPVNPSNLLIYYMARSIFPALGGSLVFVLYSTAQLNDVFDLNALNIMMMSFGFTLFFFIVSPIRFLIYTLHTKYGILEYIRNGIFGLGILLGLMVMIPGLMADRFWQGMFAWIGSRWFDFFPLVGWSRGIVSFVSHGNIWISLGFFSVYAICFWLIVLVVLDHAGYYYEDVLESTQSNEELKEKTKGKKEASESVGSLNLKKKLSLPDFGTGAVALYWRNYVHSSRQDFHPLFGLYGLGFAAIAVVMAGLSHFDWFSHKVIYFYMGIMMIMYFFAGMGRTNVGDLKKPFFILIPATWTAKFINLIKLDIYQSLIFAVALVVPTALVAGLSVGLIVLFPLCVVAFYLTGFAISLTIQIGFDEGWDRILVRPLIIAGVFVFGILPSAATGVLAYIVTEQVVYGLLGVAVGMALVATLMLHLTLDIISRVEFKEI